MSYLVAKPEDRFSRDEAHMIIEILDTERRRFHKNAKFIIIVSAQFN